LKKLTLTTIIALFILISFFPAPVHQHYHLLIKVSLGLVFLVFLARKKTSIFKKRDFTLWIFLVAIGINVFFAQQKNVSLLTYLDIALPMFFIYYIIASTKFSRDSLILFSKIICAASILVAFLGLMESMLRISLLYENLIVNPYYQKYKLESFMRAISTQFNPNVLGTYLIISLPFCYFIYKKGLDFWRDWGFIAICLSIVVALLTCSRGIFLAFFVMASTFLLINKRVKFLVIFLMAILSVVLLSTFLPFPLGKLGINGFLYYGDNIFSIFKDYRNHVTANIFINHPFFGIGFQHFRLRFYEFYSLNRLIPHEFMIADNMYLTLLAESGIMGLTCFLLFMSSMVRKARITLVKLKKTDTKYLQVSVVFFALIGLLVNMFAYDLFYWPNPYLYFCIILGLIESFWRQESFKGN